MSSSPPDRPPGYAEENKGPLILTTTSILTGIAFLFVAARIISRRISIKKIALDDYITILCIVGAAVVPQVGNDTSQSPGRPISENLVKR